MNKTQWSLIGTLVFATIFCTCGQGMAYFLNEHFISIYPIYYLTALTVMGIFLYLVSAILLYLVFKKKEDISMKLEVFLMIFCMVAPFGIGWSFFVTVMWGG